VTDTSQRAAAPSAAHPWWALSSLLIGLSIIIIDGSIVNVLLPDMVQDIGLTQTDAQWVNSIYSLVFASLLITIGLLSDRFGRRKLFLIGIVIFLLGSLGSGSAQDPSFLIASRAVQAAGAAMMLPSSIAVINVLFEGRQRAAAFGLWGAIFGGAAGLGPLLGGWLAQDFSWRWAFLVNIPIGIIAGLLVIRFVPENYGRKAKGYDPLGIVLTALGLALIVFGLIEGQSYGWWIATSDFTLGPVQIASGGLSIVPLALSLGAALLVAFVFWERHLVRSNGVTLVDLSLFSIRRYGFGNIVALVVSLGEFGILFALPLWMQSVHGTSPLTTGVILATLAIGTLISGGAARHVAAAIGPTRTVRLGMLLEVAGIAGIGLTLSVDRSPWWLVIALIIYGLGLGFASAQLTNVVLEDVPPELSGGASAMTSTFRQVGSALGAAILGSVLFGSLASIFAADLERDGSLSAQEQQQVVDQVERTAGQAIVELEQRPGMTEVTMEAKSAYTSAAQVTAAVAAGFVTMGLLVSFGLPRDRRPESGSDAPTAPTTPTPQDG
jgi:EmrB/QacA subfamily drug resistance transporter